MPTTPGVEAAGEETGAEADADADTDADGVGGRKPGVAPGVVVAGCGAIGGTAIAVVFGAAGTAVTGGATPAGILIVGMPMIVAERGASFGCAAAAAAIAAGPDGAAAAGFAAA